MFCPHFILLPVHVGHHPMTVTTGSIRQRPQEIIGLDTSNSSRRLRRLAAPAGPTVVITIKARSPEEAAETASDMDAARLHPAASL